LSDDQFRVLSRHFALRCNIRDGQPRIEKLDTSGGRARKAASAVRRRGFAFEIRSIRGPKALHFAAVGPCERAVECKPIARAE